MKIELWDIDRPVPYARNPRKIGQAAIDKVAASIKEYGWRQPLVVDGEGVIIVGHTRLLGAKKLDHKQVPVHVATDMTPQQIKAYRLADNRSNEENQWDMDLLAIEMGELFDEGFDLPLTAFNPDEIADLFGVTLTEGQTDPDDVPEPPVNPITVLGDVWLMGKHRLMCGDSISIDAVEHLLEGRKADMVFTDPPYGVSFQSGMSKGGTATRFDKLQNDDCILEVAPIVAATLRNDGVMFIWTSHQVYPTWRAQFDEWYKQTIIWHKPGGGIGDLKGNYATDYEMCIFGMKGRAHFRDKRGMAVWKVSKDNVSDYKHPTQKPVELAERACNDFTDPGYAVLDLFGGSGSTLIACERTGRSARLMEIDPKYCDVIVKRWQDHVGQEATLEGDGRTFNEMCEVRYAGGDWAKNAAGSYDDAVAAAHVKTRGKDAAD